LDEEATVKGGVVVVQSGPSPEGANNNPEAASAVPSVAVGVARASVLRILNAGSQKKAKKGLNYG
jgi:hypothetical protein